MWSFLTPHPPDTRSVFLELPGEWSQSIDAASAGNGQTCLGPAAAIQDAKNKYERALSAMRQTSQTTFIFVLHPEAISIKETRRAIGELRKLDIQNFRLIINGIIPPEGAQNPLFAARAEMQADYLAQIEADLAYPKQRMVLLAGEIKGVERLRQVGNIFFDGTSSARMFETVSHPPADRADCELAGRCAGAHPTQWSSPDCFLRRQGRGGQDCCFLHHGGLAGPAGA